MSDKKTEKVVERGCELLQQLINYQTANDGVDRPALFSFDKSKTLDQFTMDVEEVATYLTSIQKLIPMQAELASLGRKLEASGKIVVDGGESYAEKALAYLKVHI